MSEFFAEPQLERRIYILELRQDLADLKAKFAQIEQPSDDEIEIHYRLVKDIEEDIYQTRKNYQLLKNNTEIG